MDRENVRQVVRATLLLLARIAKRTRTPADDLMTSILQTQEERLVDAVLTLLQESGADRPSEEQVVKALEKVGIKV